MKYVLNSRKHPIVSKTTNKMSRGLLLHNTN